jgi:hypothetical protein
MAHTATTATTPIAIAASITPGRPGGDGSGARVPTTLLVPQAGHVQLDTSGFMWNRAPQETHATKVQWAPHPVQVYPVGSARRWRS